MALGLIGKKCGMTRIFLETGVSVPVTVVEVSPNRVTKVLNTDTDGYSALQVTQGTKRSSKVSKPMAGHFAKAGVEAGDQICEFRLAENELVDAKCGDEFTVSQFSEGQKVDVRALSKGKGFAGVVKRHNFQMQDATHGNSVSHRAHGSTGQCQFPGRVFKGKKMAGQMGNVYVTLQNQEIVKIDEEKNLLMIKGGIPGAPGNVVLIKPAVKKPFAKKENEGS